MRKGKFESSSESDSVFKVGEFYRMFGTEGLVMAVSDQNDVLFNTGREFVWGINVEMESERDQLIWDKAYYFEEYAIVPPVEELKKYRNHPGAIINGFAYAIDEVNRCAVLYSSNFPDEIAPIDQLETIPSTVEYQDQSYPVTAVADWAFYQNKQITDLALPDSIKSIGNYAFAKSDLKRLEMPAEVEKGKDIFFKCQQLIKPQRDNYQESEIKRADLDHLYNCIEKAERDGAQTHNRLWHHNAMQQMNVLYTQYLNQCDLQNHYKALEQLDPQSQEYQDLSEKIKTWELDDASLVAEQNLIKQHEIDNGHESHEDAYEPDM
ncbi:leucine-rich repeat protein [Acetobacterium woodii]|uniref:Uncharacterized protein n=1 Tax=Acetobacterium woodii (strain ATCC 29683 / DSM 1030 / JCM 2381 / KCTC 1655 / WB1) TaxID=931626 RepID=H6LDG7_ACEWD|nr:leucine-rich repeat protein [Acetobacterium woodii]AFA47939.1 hypothetical protein Awo_c11550 [Acetobacterium woodii DSM 1030]